MAAASPQSAAAGVCRLLQDCTTIGWLTTADPACPQQRLEDALGSDLAARLVGALTRKAGRPATVV